jgi:DNA-binding LacI/PurR family transcriptional regulator
MTESSNRYDKEFDRVQLNSVREPHNSKNVPDRAAEGNRAHEDAVAARAKRKSAPAKRVSELPRHRAIYEELLAEIRSGVYKPGERLPSEAILCERFQASRITVAKAFQSLQRDRLVNRRPGSGTYVEKPAQELSLQFGVLIPDFGTTDIFEPICQGILRSPAARSHSLTWGSSTAAATNSIEAAEQLCQQYIAQRVAGVFFAPTEFSESRNESNHRLAEMLERAEIPVVLLDRDFKLYPDRSNFDLVGIDNHRAGYVLTQHLIHAGAKRIVFAQRRNAASTVDARAAGYRDALYNLRRDCLPAFFNTDLDDPSEVKTMLDREHPDGIICANDITAARLMRTLVSLGVRIPRDIRMAGIDDVSYAKFLPTPLTTLRQNCSEIGAVAMSTMLDRISHPNYPVRDVLVRCELTVRASSGFVPTEAPEA